MKQLLTFNQLISEPFLENMTVHTEMEGIKLAGSASYGAVDTAIFKAQRIRPKVFPPNSSKHWEHFK